jgi:hypothetical protein
MNNEWYVINDMPAFIDHARALVFNSFGSSLGGDKDFPEFDDITLVKPEDQKELDQILSIEESLIIADPMFKKQTNKKTKKIRYMVNDTVFMQILESLNDRMISNMLNNLVNKGVLETGFDNESNDFVFWIKDNDKNKIEKPETD